MDRWKHLSGPQAGGKSMPLSDGVCHQSGLIAVGTAGVLRILDVRTGGGAPCRWAGVVVVMLAVTRLDHLGPKVAWTCCRPS